MTTFKPDDFISFENKQHLEQFLDSNLESWSELTPEMRAALLEKLDSAFQAASTVELNTPAGEPKFKVGDWHIRLRFSYWEATKTAIDLVLLIGKLKTGLGVAGGIESAVGSIDAFINRINHLDVNEIKVYNAITDVVHSKWDKTLKMPGASPAEILASFQRRQLIMPADTLQRILSGLEEKRVIKGDEGPDNQRYYEVIF